MSLALIALLPWLGAALLLALPTRQRVAAAGVAGEAGDSKVSVATSACC